MRWFYSLILYLLSPYLLVRLWWKGRRLPAYRERIKERFALSTSGEIKQYDVWLHAVSLGEVIAVTPLVEKLLQSQRKILLTTMTPTGSGQVQKQFSNRVDHCYLPYELPCVMRRFFKQKRPQLGIIVETELWPNMIHYAKNSGVNLLLVNARLSQKSYQGYKKLQWFFKPLLQQFTGIYTQGEEDAQRFRQLGADQEKVTYVGNIKYDLQLIESRSVVDFPVYNWGKDRVIVLLASTHHNEEEQILKLLKDLQASIPDLLLLIAPRHPERFQEIINLSQNMGYCTGQRSQTSSLSPDNQVVVIDSLGELLFFYQLSHIAFVGGSLVPVGGHNVLEAVAMQVPVISGRQVQNFKAIIADLEKKQAIELVNDAAGLIQIIIALYQDEQRRSNLVRNASEVLASNKGAITKYVAVINSALGNKPH